MQYEELAAEPVICIPTLALRFQAKGPWEGSPPQGEQPVTFSLALPGSPRVLESESTLGQVSQGVWSAATPLRAQAVPPYPACPLPTCETGK